MAAVAIVPVVLAATGYLLIRAPAAPGGAGSARPASDCTRAELPKHILGVAPSTARASSVTTFEAALGRQANLVEHYTRFGAPFARYQLACPQMLLLQWNPRHVPLQAILAGRYDAYLRRYASELRAYPHQVALSFAHEMNGHWSSWGYTHTSPAVFRKTWQHIHQMMSPIDPGIAWVWNPNEFTGPDVLSHPGVIAVSPAPWYPGSAYVTWIAADSYYRTPAETFHRVMGALLASVRRYHKPVLLAETAVSPGPRACLQVKSLLAGVRRSHMLGFVWFDINAQQKWTLERDPGAIRGFHAGGCKD